jgi:hypothetical protein
MRKGWFEALKTGLKFGDEEPFMADVKLVVIYPRPRDVEAFEKVYTNEHVPLAVAKLGGKTKIVATRVLASPQGVPPFYRIGSVLPLDAGAGSVCRVRRRNGSAGSRGEDLQRRRPCFLGR